MTTDTHVANRMDSVRLTPITSHNAGVMTALSRDPTSVWRALVRGPRITGASVLPAGAGLSALDPWAGTYRSFVVEMRTTGQPLGVVAAYDSDLRSGHVKLWAVALQGWRGTGLVVFGFAMVVHMMLSSEPFRKVYLDVAAYNVGQFKRLLEENCELEVTLPNALYLDGMCHDRLIYSISRRRYEQLPWRKAAAAIDPFGGGSIPEQVTYSN